MRRFLTLVVAVLVYALVHEGSHALVATAFGESAAFHVRPFGLEAEYATSVPDRAGPAWGFISGTANVVTVILGYALFAMRRRLAQSRRPFLMPTLHGLTIFFMLGDPLNLWLGPFIYGGDIGGLTVGFGVGRYPIQLLFFLIFLANREMIAQRLLPEYGAATHFSGPGSSSDHGRRPDPAVAIPEDPSASRLQQSLDLLEAGPEDLDLERAAVRAFAQLAAVDLILFEEGRSVSALDRAGDVVAGLHPGQQELPPGLRRRAGRPPPGRRRPRPGRPARSGCRRR